MNSKITSLANLTALAVLLIVSVLLFQKPYYNWDMFPYMALAATNSSESFELTHARVYREASARMSRKDFDAISQRQPGLMADAHTFAEVLPYFKLKPGYNLMVSFFNSIGIDLLTATYLPSVLSYLIIGVIMLVWMHRIIPSPFSALVTLVFMASPFLVTTARFSSPDMLCAMVCFVAFFLLTEHTTTSGLLALLIAITVRPDSAILYLVLVVAFFLNGDLAITRFLAFTVAGISLAIVVMDGPGILKEFLFTASSYSPSWNNAQRISHYTDGLFAGIASLKHSLVFLFSVISMTLLYLRKTSDRPFLSDQWNLFVCAAVCTFAIHYLLHPVMEDRFVIPSYLVILMALSKTLTERFMRPA